MEIKLVMINGVINKQCRKQTKNKRFVVFQSLLVERFFEVLQKNNTFEKKGNIIDKKEIGILFQKLF